MASHQIAGGITRDEDSRPLYFKGEHYRHWKARMRTYVQSIDYQLWLVIQDGPLPIPGDDEGKKHEGEASATTSKINKYTKEQMDVMQTNARAKHLLYHALSMEEFENVSSCETAKEIWDKLEMLHEGTITQKVKEAKISLLLHEYDHFLMKEDETIKDMFRRFNKILGDLKALGKSYSNGEQVRKILRILPRVWQTYVDAIPYESFVQMSYDELRNKLIVYEKSFLQRHGQMLHSKPFLMK
ncbi:uncharacterized protein LOC132045330 [Lycium ferocissimum]|uniref:uncharacterized protein LOC132045330 n=1 Tax=Lycium ferocissimum TaxID=112874 RepID=UPI002815CBC0|nr:uncharacterized protein LOC132045330 [Lycium ferocissimum]